MKRYLTIGVLLVSTITSFAQPPKHKGQNSSQDYANWANALVSETIAQLTLEYKGVVRDAAGNVVTSEASATAQAAAGPGATFDSKTGAVYDANGNLWDSNAALTAQDVGGAGATLN